MNISDMIKAATAKQTEENARIRAEAAARDTKGTEGTTTLVERALAALTDYQQANASWEFAAMSANRLTKSSAPDVISTTIATVLAANKELLGAGDRLREAVKAIELANSTVGTSCGDVVNKLKSLQTPPSGGGSGGGKPNPTPPAPTTPAPNKPAEDKKGGDPAPASTTPPVPAATQPAKTDEKKGGGAPTSATPPVAAQPPKDEKKDADGGKK